MLQGARDWSVGEGGGDPDGGVGAGRARSRLSFKIENFDTLECASGLGRGRLQLSCISQIHRALSEHGRAYGKGRACASTWRLAPRIAPAVPEALEGYLVLRGRSCVAVSGGNKVRLQRCRRLPLTACQRCIEPSMAIE